MTKQSKKKTYWEKLVEEQSYPVLLVLRGKHETDYYLSNSKEQFLATCLEILRRRVDDDQYIQRPDVEPYGLEPEITEEIANGLPEPYRTQALGVRKYNQRRRDEHAESIVYWNDVQRALEEKDGQTAFRLLWDRRDYEYENIDREFPEVVPVP